MEGLSVKNIRRQGIRANRGGRPNPEYARSIIDGIPTPERLAKTEGFFEIGDDKQGTRVYRLQDHSLGRMKQRDAIDNTEYAALQKYKHHWSSAGLECSPQSVDLNRIFSADPGSMSGMAKTEAQAHHRQQYRKAREQFGNRQAILIDRVVLEDWTLEAAGATLGWRNRPQAISAATEMIRDAGYRLAKLWGIG